MYHLLSAASNSFYFHLIKFSSVTRILSEYVSRLMSKCQILADWRIPINSEVTEAENQPANLRFFFHKLMLSVI